MQRKRQGEGARAADGRQRFWLDQTGNVNKIVYAVYAICAVLLAIDPLISRYGPFAIERWFGFYGLYSLAACVVLVIVAKQVLRRLVMRPEDYYDD